MKSPFTFFLTLTLLLFTSNECNAFGVQPQQPTTLRTGSPNPSSQQPRLDMSSHVSSQDSASVATLQHPTKVLTTTNTNTVNVKSQSSSLSLSNNEENNDMATMVSIAGLTMLAMMLSMSATTTGGGGGALQQQHYYMMDDGSAATLIVDAFFLGIAGVVSLVSSSSGGKTEKDSI